MRTAARCEAGAVTMAGQQVRHEAFLASDKGFRYFGRYAMVLLIEGSGWYEDDRGTKRACGPGDVILVLPEVGHRYGCERGGLWHELYLVFEGPVFDALRHPSLWLDDQPLWHVVSPQNWAQRMRQVLVHEASTPNDAFMEVTRVQCLLAELFAGHTDPSRQGSLSPWAEKAQRLIDKNLAGPIDWHAFTMAMHVSASTLRRRFHQHFGMSPTAYRNHRLIEKACAMMHHSRRTDQQIADALGFCDPYYFSRCFKQVMGLSPRAYRRSLP